MTPSTNSHCSRPAASSAGVSASTSSSAAALPNRSPPVAAASAPLRSPSEADPSPWIPLPPSSDATAPIAPSDRHFAIPRSDPFRPHAISSNPPPRFVAHEGEPAPPAPPLAPRARAYAPHRGGYGNPRRNNGGGNVRRQRDGYNNFNFHQNQFQPRNQRPIFRPPAFPFYPQPFPGYANMMAYPDSQVQFVYFPFQPQPQPFPTDYFPAAPQPFDPQVDALKVDVRRQIEFWFSDGNLVSDDFLRQNMDRDGWVPVYLIAGFNRMQALTSSIPLILDAMRGSYLVEVMGDRMRTRLNPSQWPLPPSQSTESQQSNNLESQMRNMALNEGTSSQT